MYQSQVDTVVPEHFKEQYPKLVSFLKAYYDYLDSDGQPTNDLKNIFYAKEAGSTSDKFLDLLFQERIPGIDKETFPAPRFAYQLLPGFYRTKGTSVAVEGFFRYFFQEDVTQIFPKDNTFIVGESRIGAESLRYIQDSFFYQIYSILIRSNIPRNLWFNYYNEYLHPAGFNIFSEVVFETIPENSQIPETMPTITDLLSVETEDVVVASEASVETTALFNITGIDSDVISMGDSGTRFYLDRGINFYQDSFGSIGDSYDNYTSIADILNVNSPTLDDSSTSGSIILMSDTIQTTDEDVFPFYFDSATDTP
tara:strand:- start:3588 stop:4520 length:933 start_codon:yes stop_codon:yes gene_type:complete